jgi:hypothetical protein
VSAVPFSYRQYAGNGSTTSFSVPFPYLLKSHVKVYIGFNILDGTYSSELADGTGFTWSSGTQIQCTTAPASGQTLTVIRVTPNTTRLVDWQDGSNLISNDLDTADLQNLYVIQEQQDRNDAGITQSTAAQVAAAAATTASTTATTTANTALSTANTALSTANTASSNASAAVSTANTASTNASAAVATANTASTNASAAVSTANTASSNASSAVATANSAVSTANSAATAASSAVTTANNANTTAQAANTTATNAESIANSALSIVAGTVQFVPVANVAAIPGSPSNDDAIQVQDSTGIESFSPLTGLPAGFTGTPQLFVRIQYDTPGSTWQYVGYGANDPDNRYVVQGVTGTANNPSFYFDPDTGIYSPGANELGLSTGGAARLTIDSAGNVAIPGTLGVTGAITGSLTGSASLNVLKAGDTMTGSLTAPALIPSGSTVPTNGVYLPAANSVAISTNGTGRLFVDSAGNVGIGRTALTGQAIAAQGAKGITSLTSSTGTNGVYHYFQNTGGTFYLGLDSSTGSDFGATYAGAIYHYGNYPIVFGTNGTERMRLDSSGRLGLGTSGPLYKLQIEGSSSTVYSGSARNTLLGVYNPDTTSGAYAGIELQVAGAGNASLANISAIDAGSGSTDVAIGVRNSNTFEEKVRIKSSGAVGIGVTGPSTALDVSGVITTRSDTFAAVRFKSSTGVDKAFLSYEDGSTAVFLNNYGSGPIAFKTADTERARLTSDGKWLVGTSTARSNVRYYGNSTTPTLQVETTGDNWNNGISVINNSAGGYAGVIRVGASAGSSVGSNTLVANGTTFGAITFVAADGTNLVDGASIVATTDGTTSSGDLPTRLVFSTTADGASSPTERMRIHNGGCVSVANGLVIGSLGAVTNSLNISGSVIASGAGNSTLKWNTSSGTVTYDTSSRLVKNQIVNCPYGISEIKKLQPRKYFRTDDQREEIGFIADEMVQVMPEFVPIGPKSVITKNEEDTEQIPIGVNYEKLTAVLTAALQEAIGEIEKLKARVVALESKP